MKNKKKMKQMTAVLLAVTLLASCLQLNGAAAENSVSEETWEQSEVSEIEQENELLTIDVAAQEVDGGEIQTRETENSLTQTSEIALQTEQTEILEAKNTEETLLEEVLSEEPQSERLSEEGTADALAEEVQTQALETEEAIAEEEVWEETPTEAIAEESTEEILQETPQVELSEIAEMESANEAIMEETQSEVAESAYIMPLDNGEAVLDDTAQIGQEFELQNGDTDITSGKFGATLAHITFSTQLGETNNTDVIKALNPHIIGADGAADAYFKNLDIIAESAQGETAAAQYRFVADVKAQAPTGTYTVSMTADGKRDTATFTVAEKGIESLKIKNIPTVVSSEKKISIKPTLEINGDLTGTDKTLLPKNKKVTWDVVTVEGTTTPASLKINLNNGTVTINANESGAFRIKATTADKRYTDANGAPISTMSETIEVVSQNDSRLESLEGCTIVLTDSPDSAKAKLLNQTGKTVDMGSLDGTKAYLKIQKADGTFVNPADYTLKANNKAFRIGEDASASCVLTKPIAQGKTLTVKLTATLVNGKKEKSLKGDITIQSAASGEQDLSLALGVTGADRSELKDNGRTLEYSGSASTLIKMELMRNQRPVGSPASYNIKLKNLKKVSETVSKDNIVLYATMKSASGSVTLTDCSTGTQTTYEVKNLEKTAALGKSPTIKQKTIPAASTGADYTVTAKGKAVTDYTHVRVELLPADYIKSCKNSKSQGKYRAFASALGINPYDSENAYKVYALEGDTLHIPFVKAEQPQKASYKLQMTVGKMTGNRFVAAAAPITVTTKVSGRQLKPETESTGEILVAYFSATNTTERVAQRLANGMGADLYEIVPQIPYTSADLNYNNANSRANKEMNDSTARPAISGTVENMEKYDIVFLGYPIWWGQAPKIMYTFMESYDFSGKTIVPFCTSGSSGTGSSATNLASVTNGATWLAGRRFSGSVSENELMDWVDSLDLERKPKEEPRLSQIESVSSVAGKEEYDKVLPPAVWTGKPENFADISPTYTLVSSQNQITVAGSLKKVEGFTGFSQEESSQSGYYMLARIKLPTLAAGMTYNAMTGKLKALNDKTLTNADLTTEGTDIYLNALVKVADADAATAANVTLTLDYDGEGQTYAESTYTFDLSGVKLEKDTENRKVLVAYFSATNTTEGVAQRLADGMGADLYEIVPEVPYTSADLNYGDSNSRTSKEMNDSTARPAISGTVENMAQYDVVFLGYPIWWGEAPRIICTFMESYDFSGKTIVPFCTSGSSPIGSSAINLQPLTNGATWLAGRRFSSNVSQNDLMEWVEGLGLNL